MIDLNMVDWQYFQSTYFWVTSVIAVVLGGYVAWKI